jgi:tetratricopeptide (TPR) repeat protein
MTRFHHRQVMTAFVVLAVALALCGPQVKAQEKISPLSDYQYRKDLAAVETIVKEADLQKRADALAAFVKANPISRTLAYVASSYVACTKPYMQKDWAKVISMEESLYALLPTKENVQAQGIPVGVDEFFKENLVPAQVTILSAIMGAHYQSNNLPKAAETGEKAYVVLPDKAMAATLADIYLKMQNYDKYLVYGDKTLANYPMEQAYVTALQMAQVYIQKADVAHARELYTKVLTTFGDKTPQGMQEAQWNTIKAISYTLDASEAYKQKDYPKAITLYGKVAAIDSKRDDAYYYIGMSKWNSKDQVGAIEAFAKAVVLNKTNAPKAKEYMEQLYKAEHSGSTDGLDQVLTKAKADLGI